MAVYRKRRRILLATIIVSATVGILAAGWSWSTRNPQDLTLQELAQLPAGPTCSAIRWY